ncbi:MAG: para-nitrobenzyl esterase [Paraburkholderia sp.]|nr:para-nitrobenzyl esterase [Paraburkholderia sp.]
MQLGSTDLNVFRGIPYAAPPIGEFRWREPQPLARWAGVRSAAEFGPRCMQLPSNREAFRSGQMSEDCLHLNIWTPARAMQEKHEKLPVLVYFHGGGFDAGDGSEGRYDGANLAARGIVMVTVNYRLGVFGFLSMPESARESSQGTGGNYGLLDQVAALRWVRENIAAFGGDPEQVTIGGESAGAISVSAHMVSPLSRGLFARAIGESGAMFAPIIKLPSRSVAESNAIKYAGHAVATSLKELRTKSADALLSATEKGTGFWFGPIVDGYFLTDTPKSSFGSGAQARVPLLIGSNAQDGDFSMVLEGTAPTPGNWRRVAEELFTFEPMVEEALKYYPGNNEQEVLRSATTLAADMFLSHVTWRWMDQHRRTGQAPVYFYEFRQPRPSEAVKDKEQKLQAALGVSGAANGAEIEYALGNLDNQPRYVWKPEDREVSRLFSGYIAQFVKTGNPNGNGLPDWPAAREEKDGLTRQVIATQTHTERDDSAARQAFLQHFFEARRLGDDS